MKKIVLLLILVVSLPMMAQAQCDKSKHDNNKNRTEWFAQMRAKKLLFLVDAMDLTETEKAAFSVLFEKNEVATNNCYREMRSVKKSMSAEPTEEDYKKAVELFQESSIIDTFQPYNKNDDWRFHG